MKRIRLGVSRCLLGDAVRYDGGQRRCDPVCVVLAERFDLVPFCPEVAAGLGVPRPAVGLVLNDGVLHMRGVQVRERDVTLAVQAACAAWLANVGDLDGFVLKSASPSCGVGSALITGLDAPGDGLFVRQLRAAFPEIPLIEEGALEDAGSLADFIRKVRAHAAHRA